MGLKSQCCFCFRPHSHPESRFSLAVLGWSLADVPFHPETGQRNPLSGCEGVLKQQLHCSERMNRCRQLWKSSSSCQNSSGEMNGECWQHCMCVGMRKGFWLSEFSVNMSMFRSQSLPQHGFRVSTIYFLSHLFWINFKQILRKNVEIQNMSGKMFGERIVRLLTDFGLAKKVRLSEQFPCKDRPFHQRERSPKTLFNDLSARGFDARIEALPHVNVWTKKYLQIKSKCTPKNEGRGEWRLYSH